MLKIKFVVRHESILQPLTEIQWKIENVYRAVNAGEFKFASQLFVSNNATKFTALTEWNTPISYFSLVALITFR